MNIVDVERGKYEDMWGVDAYAEHSPGEMFLPLFLNMIGAVRRSTIIDAGCGSGKGALALQNAGFVVRCCDLTNTGLIPEARTFPFSTACLWDDLVRVVGFADWVYCCDVLEHIPTEFTMLVIARLLAVARKGVFLSISFAPDVMGAWIGKPLHQTVQHFVWWRDNLNTIGELVEARDLLNAGVFLVKPR